MCGSATEQSRSSVLLLHFLACVAPAELLGALSRPGCHRGNLSGLSAAGETLSRAATIYRETCAVLALPAPAYTGSFGIASAD